MSLGADSATNDAAISAEIIPFPRAFRAAVPEPVQTTPANLVADVVEPTGPEIDPQERLRRALAQLQTALAEQRNAVAAWRGALADLGGSVNGLRGSFETLQGRLETLKTQLQR